MNNRIGQVNRFLQIITKWASSQIDIQVVALVGSYARGTANESSDIDLVIITDKPRKYLEHTQWVTHFGKVITQRIEYYGKVTSIRICYTSGLEVEYGITDNNWVSLPLDEGTRQVIQDGMMILFERNALLSLVGD